MPGYTCCFCKLQTMLHVESKKPQIHHSHIFTYLSQVQLSILISRAPRAPHPSKSTSTGEFGIPQGDPPYRRGASERNRRVAWSVCGWGHVVHQSLGMDGSHSCGQLCLVDYRPLRERRWCLWESFDRCYWLHKGHHCHYQRSELENLYHHTVRVSIHVVNEYNMSFNIDLNNLYETYSCYECNFSALRTGTHNTAWHCSYRYRKALVLVPVGAEQTGCVKHTATPFFECENGIHAAHSGDTSCSSLYGGDRSKKKEAVARTYHCIWWCWKMSSSVRVGCYCV